MVHLVQLSNGAARRVAVVEEPHLRCIESAASVYELLCALPAAEAAFSRMVLSMATGEVLDYDPLYLGQSDWRLLPPVDVPARPRRCMISGTGLTHLGSARDRQAMHRAAAETPRAAAEMTDSMRMFALGVAGGKPPSGKIGVAPEWFYKGDGSMVRAHLESLVVPGYGEDGGEEAEVAGVYFIGSDGAPRRVGLCAGNEFSDHKFEKRNYLNLAGSKLRTCGLGPELVVGAPFGAITGNVSIERAGATLWEKTLETGEENMAHSLANLEHHHFKFEAHRQPGDLHVHFYGAHALSFGDKLDLADGDWMTIRFDGLGRPLRNPIAYAGGNGASPVRVVPLD